MKDILMRMDKRFFIIIFLLSNLSACSLKDPIKNPKADICCGYKEFTGSKVLNYYNPDLSSNIIEVGSYTSSPTPVNISINNNGDGLILWNDGAKKLERNNIVGQQYSIADNFGKSEVSVDSDGNGILVWTSNRSSLSENSNDKNLKLFGILLKNYLPSGKEFLINDDIINNPEEVTFKVGVGKEGNGLVIWKANNKKIYGYNIHNFNIINENILDISNDDNLNNLFILSFGSDFGIKKVLNNSSNIYSEKSQKLDSYGNGYITWINENKSLEVKLIKEYAVMNTSNIISSSITGPYQIDLDTKGNGLMIWQDNYGSSSIHIEVINNFFTTRKTEIFSNNKEPILNPTLKINSLYKGFIVWYSSKKIYSKFIYGYIS